LASETDIARIEKLIEKGQGVAATRRPAPKGVRGPDRVDNGMFAGWVSQSMTFLESILSLEHPYVRRSS